MNRKTRYLFQRFVACMLVTTFMFLSVTPRRAEAFWPYVTAAMWVFEQARSREVTRTEDHAGTVSFIVCPPSPLDQFFKLREISIPAQPSGQNNFMIAKWNTVARVWAPKSGHDLEKIQVTRGWEIMETYKDPQKSKMRYVDIPLPPDLGVGDNSGKTEHFEVVLFLSNGERVSINFSILARTLEDWHSQMLIERNMSKLIAYSKAQLHPERTNTFKLIVAQECGVAVWDELSDPKDNRTWALSKKALKPGVYDVRVKGSSIRIQVNRGDMVMDPAPVDGYSSIGAEGSTQIQLYCTNPLAQTETPGGEK